VQQIKSLGMKAGVALNPHTPVSLLADILHDIDLVCLMSVNPGFGGQSFIPHTYQKIRQLRRMIDEASLQVDIEIDGGVTLANAASLVQAGATVLVAGNTVFRAPDPNATITQLKVAG
jgi:ribulose-phosphate 3-epimerase